MAKLSFFLSYSRQESPFVDALLDVLEDNGHSVWVDYKKLTPGRPWLNQILAGIDAADIMLLVVSKSSMASSNVADEYKYALEKKKRVILLLFEAAPLPVEIQSCEWVDARGAFYKHYENLIAQINQPAAQTTIPQSGFKAPAIVWACFLVSLVVLLISISSWWTLFIPLLLIPLPAQILTRSVNYYRVRFALLTLPVALIFNMGFLPSTYSNFQFIIFPLFCSMSFIISPLLLFLLSLKEMRVWGKPLSSTPEFANPFTPNVEQPEPTPFYIEYAPEDKKYADALIQKLTEHHHPQAPDAEQAKISFALISHYKNSTAIDPEKHVLYPVIIQDTEVVDPKIQRIQWIDFRRGLRHLDSLAMLLPQPAKMLEALSVAPIGRQTIYPRIIQMLEYYLTLLGFFSLSIWTPLALQLGKEFLQYQNFRVFVIVNFILTSATLLLAFYSRRALTNRQGWLSSLWALFSASLLMGFISAFQTIYMIDAINTVTKANVALANAETDMRGAVILFLPCSFTLGFILIAILCIWNWRDLTRWFPYKGK